MLKKKKYKNKNLFVMFIIVFKLKKHIYIKKLNGPVTFKWKARKRNIKRSFNNIWAKLIPLQKGQKKIHSKK